MNPALLKKKNEIIFHKANFKNVPKSNKFKSSNEIVSLKIQNLSGQLTEQEKSLKKRDSDIFLKKIENKYLIMRNPGLFKFNKRESSSNRLLNINKYKELILKNKSIKQKEESPKKISKQLTQKNSKLINNNKTIKKNYSSCNGINNRLKRCKTVCNNNLNKDKLKETKINNIQTNKGEILSEQIKRKGKTENFINSIKRKFLCCLYI